jgi:outer membrane protein assembly factor BamD
MGSPYTWTQFELLAMKRSPRVLSVLFLAVALLSGCSLFGKGSKPIQPVDVLYRDGQTKLERSDFENARDDFQKIVTHYADTEYAPLARFLIAETYYREPLYDKAIKELEAFMAFYPSHRIADLAQYRLALSYYNQSKTVEQDQTNTAKALEALRKLVKEYPDSRYTPDALSKIDLSRERLAQKELWIANYNFTRQNYAAALQRIDAILKEYPRTLVVPETLYLLGEILTAQGKSADAQRAFQQLADQYPHTDWGRRASLRLTSARR